MTKPRLRYLSVFSHFFILQIEEYQSTNDSNHRIPMRANSNTVLPQQT